MHLIEISERNWDETNKRIEIEYDVFCEGYIFKDYFGVTVLLSDGNTK